MKAIIFGIPQENYNFKKIEGIAQAFESTGHDTYVTTGDKLRSWKDPCDIAFIESDVPEDFNFSTFKKVVIWQNWSISRISKISRRHPDVKFCLGAKTSVHDKTFRNYYYNTFKTYEYQRYDETHEVIDLQECEILHSNVQKLSSNLSYAFLPLTAASDPRFNVEKDIDVVYFGTASNRPNIINALRNLQTSHPKISISAHFVEKGGPIHPEICVQKYRRAKVCLHEQVGPMWGEFAVRFGEATAQGCRVISYMPFFGISDYFSDSLIPEHDYARNMKDLIDRATYWLEDRDDVKKKRLVMREKTSTHIDFVNRIDDAFREIEAK